MTMQELEEQYKDREKDDYYYYVHSMLGTEEDARKAYDENGTFRCIHWAECLYCPAFCPQCFE